jgi:hypothetical protein
VGDGDEQALRAQVRYYRARAGEYDETHDVATASGWFVELVDELDPRGTVLEILVGPAYGRSTWSAGPTR